MNTMTTDDSMSDEVFESPEVTEAKAKGNARAQQNENYFYADRDGTTSTYYEKKLDVKEDDNQYHRTPSPTGYPGYKPPKEALRMYALQSEYFIENKIYDKDEEDETRDGNSDIWSSYHPVERFDESVSHKTILLGDSGVGKTSFLVKFNTGEFRAGSFSATVGIALTVSPSFYC